MTAIDDRTAPTPSAASLFPLGRRIDDGKGHTDPSKTGGRVPFAARFAVAPDVADLEIMEFSYDSVQQIGVINDGREIVPLLKHSTGKTRTNTAKQDSGPNDSDTDHTED